jgi:hypothetical protein
VEVAAMSSRFWLWAAAILLLSRASTGGERLPTPSEAGDTIAEQITALVEQLDAPGFAERQAASQQLEDIGASAALQLELAVKVGTREVSGRALDILRRHFEQGSDEASQAARGVLTRLAASNHASTAQKARDALDPPKPPVLAVPGFNAGFGANRAANFQIVFGGNGRSIRVSDINGRRSMEIADRQRQVTLQTLPGGNIDVQITDRQNGPNATRRLTAKDVEELKGKDAEIGRIYEEFGRANPLPRIAR